MHRVTCSEEWCSSGGGGGKRKKAANKKKREGPTKKKISSYDDDVGEASPQKKKRVGRYSQLLFLRAAPAAVIDPLHGSAGQQCDALAALSCGKTAESESESESRPSMIDGQDAELGSTSVRFCIEMKILQQKMKVLHLKKGDFGATRWSLKRLCCARGRSRPGDPHRPGLAS